MNRVVGLLLFLLCACAQTNAQTNDTTTWTVLSGGTQTAGFIKRWKNADGSFTEWRQFNDRGRGDSTVTTYTYDTNGYIVSLSGAGVDYYKKPVVEKFENINGQVRWSNSSEKEERTIDYPAEYLTLNVDAGQSFRHYLNSPGHTIRLLPSGESTLTIVSEKTLANGKHIRMISLSGSDFTPDVTWIDENDEFFGYGSDYMAFIRKGYESCNRELIDTQNQFDDTYLKDLSKRLTQTYTGLVIQNASMFDARSGKVKLNTSILVENGMVREVSTNKKLKVPKGYKVIDATGKFAMPGLWDNHVHYSGSNGVMHMGCGVTHVRDMANSFDLLDQKKEIDEGRMIGPRIITAGIIEGTGPFSAPTDKRINTVDEGIVIVRKYAELGYPQIKLYSSLKPEWVKPLAEEAKRLNMRVSGHIPAHMLAEEAIRDGFNEIQHINMLFLNFYGKELDTRSTVRFVMVAQKAASFDFEDPKWKSFLKLLRDYNIAIDPTVSTFEDKFTARAGTFKPTIAGVATRLPVTRQRDARSGSSIAIPSGMEETYKASFDSMLKMIRQLHDHGIAVLPGTDYYPVGFMLHRELENYVRAGIPNNEVLKLATWTSAEVNRSSDQYGSIEANRPADIIIIDGNPSKDIRDLQRVEIVIKDKSMYETRELLKSYSIKGF
ncbi:amidohydrolase family protein [Chryseolinea sp. T2]|uniref:amidohydrolase family protein n=1 Tax=Chryseolinea sp. T2 TaxID=3129255 RepID=UPI003076966D